MESWVIILIHQIVFQGMFVIKNIVLSKKTGKRIRGKNKEATVSIVFFAVFIFVTLVFSISETSTGEFRILSNSTAMISGIVLLLLNLTISLLSLVDLKDSWRVGILENEKTELVSSGIYELTRNPYFLSYLIMFAAYTVILQNVIILVLSIIGFFYTHKMILKEEAHLYSMHGNTYEQYKKKVPRYLIV